MPLRPGETFGRYQLAQLLGRGAMGEVYSAYDTVLDRKVALKVLTVPEGAFVEGPTSSKGAARILREARAAAGITHPNAVPIYDIGEVEGVPFLAMELVDGRNMRAFVGDLAIPMARRLRWVIDVARALGAAHKLGVVHRDIKPENVMVRDDGVVKVLDFGIARRSVAKDEAEPPPNVKTDLAALSKLAMTNGTLTAEGAVLGTPMYMAPEQLLGEALDGRTDQFAWGVLAYEMLTGKIPWEGEGVMILSKILSQEVAPLTERLPDVPARVDAVIRKALSKSPANRFPKMEELADELEPYAAITGSATRGDQVAISVRDPLSVAPTEQVPVSVGSSISVTGGAVARTQEQAVLRPRRARRGFTWGVGALALLVAAGAGLGLKLRAKPDAQMVALPDAAPAEVPSRMSSNVDATAAYNAGMQALRDGAMGAALKNLTRATELDPLFGAPQLRLIPTKLLAQLAQSIPMADLQAARTSQASLGTHDRVLLEAFELAAQSPPDIEGGKKVLKEAAEKHPADGDFLFALGILSDLAIQPSEAEKALEASLARDPTFATGWRFLAEVRLELDNVDGATEAFTQCLKVSPGATTCLADLANVQGNEGKCRDLVTTAKQLGTVAPDAQATSLFFARGLLGSGEDMDAVRAALRRVWEPSDNPPLARAFAEASLAILEGNFPEAERQYELASSAAAKDEGAIFPISYGRVLLDLEQGRAAPALKIAESYLRRIAGLAAASDDSLDMAAAELSLGSITRAKFNDLRDRWLARHTSLEPQFRWLPAYALPADTQESSKTALEAMPAIHPLVSILALTPDRAEPIGRTLSLAGKVDDAIPYLEKASASCNLLDGRYAIFSTWASFDLAEALEKRGEVSRACEAYARVLTRWGRATQSRTAARARTRSRALGCNP